MVLCTSIKECPLGLTYVDTSSPFYLYLEGRGDACVNYLTQGGLGMAVYDKIEGAQVMHCALQEPPLWVPPHQVVKSLAPECGSQCIPQAPLPCHGLPAPSQAGDYLK